jgi:hypothetical protein
VTSLSLAQWIAFTNGAAASVERQLEVETDPTAALILRSGLARLRQQLEMLHMTDKQLDTARAEAEPGDTEADLARIDSIHAELHRRSQLTSHQRVAEAAERRRLRDASSA